MAKRPDPKNTARANTQDKERGSAAKGSPKNKAQHTHTHPKTSRRLGGAAKGNKPQEQRATRTRAHKDKQMAGCRRRPPNCPATLEEKGSVLRIEYYTCVAAHLRSVVAAKGRSVDKLDTLSPGQLYVSHTTSKRVGRASKGFFNLEVSALQLFCNVESIVYNLQFAFQNLTQTHSHQVSEA